MNKAFHINGLLTAITLVLCALIWPVCESCEPREDEWIAAEIPDFPCLTWREHQEKYPNIKDEYLLSAMLVGCPR